MVPLSSVRSPHRNHLQESLDIFNALGVKGRSLHQEGINVKHCINPAIKTPRIRGAFYLFLLLAACAIPFALAQRDIAANTARRLAMPKLPTGFPLWDQYDNAATEPPINIGSQDFEPAFDTLDDQAADDFVLPDPGPGIGAFVTGVRVMGEYSDGGGPASSFNVYF